MRRQDVETKEAGKNFSRREFLAASGLALAGLAMQGCASKDTGNAPEPIIDIHQHVGYKDRSDADTLAHQRGMGVTQTILLPSGRPVSRASTHNGLANGLQASAHGNERCYHFAKKHPGEYLFAANEVPDLAGATLEIEKYLKLGAVMIAEQKFGVDSDGPVMRRIYELAQVYEVPVLLHFQMGMYNHGLDRFHKVLEQFPRVKFIGHAQTWWANVDKSYKDDEKNLYPKGPITPGGLTERLMADYPNMYGDLSAGSGLNALTRDETFTPGFLKRHQDKLLYGSDCVDVTGLVPECQGAKTIAAVRRFAPNKKIERKLLYENARRMFRL